MDGGIHPRGIGRTIAGFGAVAVLIGGSAAVATAASSAGATGLAKVQRTFSSIVNKPLYRQADWGYTVIDQKTGRTLLARNQQKMFDPGSTMKLYSVPTALSKYGPNYRFRTPVYREGKVSGGTLTGNLVLVGSGDLTFGLRQRRNGTLYYESLPKANQSYANQLPGAVEPPGNPLSALNQLAKQVKASGITRVDGNVVVDQRLFEPYTFPDGLVSPIWVNENLIDLLVKPGRVGKSAKLNWRPMTGSYVVRNRVRTVKRGKATNMTVAEPTPGTLVISGQIPAGAPPTLRIWEVDHPGAFARTAFIEALRRAGVAVTAPDGGSNPTSLLPRKGSYRVSDRVAQRVSVKFSQYTKLILKVSYNRGADLMACLAAVRVHSTNCLDGVAAEVKTAVGLGVSRTGVFPQDAAGSDDQGRTTPAALATLLRGLTKASYGNTLFQSLPILGRDGTLANVEDKSPAAGHAWLKTGNRVVSTPAGQTIVLGNSLAGYVQTKSGRRVIMMVAVGNVPLRTADQFFGVVNDQAAMVVSVQQNL